MGFFSSKEEYATKLVYTNNEFPLRYQIKQNTLLLIKEEIFSETSADIIWRIDNWKKNDDGYEVSIIIEKNEAETSVSQMKEVLNFMKLFNYPISHVKMQLNNSGFPITILNQNEIYGRWMELRNSKFLGMDQDDATKDIIFSGDNDFNHTLPSLLRTIYYCLFFPPILGKKNISTSNFNKLNLPSILFQGLDISTIIKERIEGISNVDLRIHHSGIGEISDYKKAEKIYKDGYKQIVGGDSFNYKYNYEAYYKYNVNGKIDRCKAEILERASEKVVSKQTISINILKE